MKIVATIEARMTSSRLPGKVLMPIMGKPMLAYLIERLKRSRVDEIVVATTDRPTDDPIEQLATNLGVGCFRGSEEDVLGRVLLAAKSVGADVIVEITGDCPLIDPDIVDQVLDVYLSQQVDYASNTLKRTYPRGLDVQVFSTNLLDEVNILTSDPIDHEHVSLYIYEHPEKYRLANLESGLSPAHANLRLTVDTIEDFSLIESVYNSLYLDNPNFSMGHVLAYLSDNPGVAKINSEIHQKPVR